MNKENSDLILQYIGDMEYGINISTGNRKGVVRSLLGLRLRYRIKKKY